MTQAATALTRLSKILDLKPGDMAAVMGAGGKATVTKRLGVEYAYPTQTLYVKQAEPGLPAPDEGVFQPAVSEDNAMALGRDEARAIVAATTGLDVVPPPVGRRGGDGDERE